MAVLFIIIAWIVLTFILAKLAENKMRSYKIFFIIGLFLSPIIGYIILLAIGDKSKALQRKHIKKGIVKICPFCAGANILKGEPIIICQNCKREIRTEYYKGKDEEDEDFDDENYEESDDDENDEAIKNVFDEIFEKKKLYENAYEEDKEDENDDDNEHYSKQDKKRDLANDVDKHSKLEEKNISNNKKETVGKKYYYCKHCGVKNTSVTGLINGSGCQISPSKKHELYEGSENNQYICKYCGVKNSSIMGLVINSYCPKSPTKRHEPAL